MRRSGLIIGRILALTCAGVSHNIHAGMARSLVQAGRLSGHWHIRYTWRCANTPRNLLACAALNGGHEIAIMGLRRTTIAHQETDDFVSDSRGNFSGHGQEIVTEPAMSLPIANRLVLASARQRGVCAGHRKCAYSG